jgi:hypothetical protein
MHLYQEVTVHECGEDFHGLDGSAVLVEGVAENDE